MNAKTLGIIGAVGSPVIGIAALGFYAADMPAFAILWGAIALIWAGLSIFNFRAARRQRRGN